MNPPCLMSAWQACERELHAFLRHRAPEGGGPGRGAVRQADDGRGEPERPGPEGRDDELSPPCGASSDPLRGVGFQDVALAPLPAGVGKLWLAGGGVDVSA